MALEDELKRQWTGAPAGNGVSGLDSGVADGNGSDRHLVVDRSGSSKQSLIRIIPMGGCTLHNPLAQLYRRHAGRSIFAEMGFRNSPFALSANANVQLVDFTTRKLIIPEWIRHFTYGDGTHEPNEDQSGIFSRGEIALVEMSSPVEYMFEGFVLNINRFEEVLLTQLSQLNAERKLLQTWRSAMLKNRHEIRKEAAEKLYALIPQEDENQRNLARFVLGTTTRILGTEEMEVATAQLRDRLGIPIGLVLHNFQFMPDGRPVSWPADFKGNSAEVARRLGIPTLDFAPFVEKEGVGKVMAPDRRHWNPAYFPQLAEMMYDFCASVLERPPLRQMPMTPARLEPVGHPAPVVPARRVVPSPASAPSSPRQYLFDHRTGGHMPADEKTIFVVVVLGQTWAAGANGDVADTAVTTRAEHPGHALMFDAGLRPRDRQARRFIDLYERSTGSAKETPCAGMADQIMRNCELRFGRKPRMLFFSVARAGTNLSGAGMSPEDGLQRGTVQHRELVNLVRQARELAAEQGARLEVAAICLLQGENEAGRNMEPFNYRRGISLLQQRLDADIRGLTGQAEPVRLYLTQTNRGSFRFEAPDIPIAQLRSQDDNPLVRCVGPTYFAPPEVRDGGVASHVKAVGYRRIGQLVGRFLLDDMWGAHRSPLQVADSSWSGPKTIRLRYNRPIALEDNDARINISDLGPGLGIEFNDGTAWSPRVESVRLIRGRDCELDVELTAPSTGFRKRLLIASRLTGAGGNGRLEGARSGIRSKEPFDTDPLDGTLLFDWACMEEIVLP